MTIGGYRDDDRGACRKLGVELTQWHRDIHAAPEIGGDDPGAAFDDHPAAVCAEIMLVAEVA